MIPGAYGDRSLLFAGVYVAMRVVLAALAGHSLGWRSPVLRSYGSGLVAGPLQLAGGILPGTTRMVLWSLQRCLRTHRQRRRLRRRKRRRPRLRRRARPRSRLRHLQARPRRRRHRLRHVTQYRKVRGMLLPPHASFVSPPVSGENSAPTCGRRSSGGSRGLVSG
ncbi:hypothetical protein [Micromonospora sp. ATA51]|uniref:hypothetical protein n=1 Tax=Micromonospora sp. ATA51 TaxID=2806098 RepID=UPI001A6467DF|nr:hypothetical protein [Micromonospora sp. ATA51]